MDDYRRGQALFCLQTDIIVLQPDKTTGKLPVWLVMLREGDAMWGCACSYWWCSCGRGRKGWSRPGCKGKRWWGRCSRMRRRRGTWCLWCYTTSPSRRPSLWKPCSTPPAARRPTPPSSCPPRAPPPRCSLGDTDLLGTDKNSIDCSRSAGV